MLQSAPPHLRHFIVHLENTMWCISMQKVHAYFIENIIMFIDRIEVFNDKRVKIHFTFEDVLAGYAE